MKLKGMIVYVVCILLLVACSEKQGLEAKIIKPSKKEFVTGNITFRPYDKEGHMLKNVSIIIISCEGKVIDVLNTKKHGEVKKELTVPLDKKYSNTSSGNLETRGIVTAIAYKGGYRPVVIFEVLVKEVVIEPFQMLRKIPGEKNEPIGILSNVHHLDINALVDKYYKYKKIQ